MQKMNNNNNNNNNRPRSRADVQERLKFLEAQLIELQKDAEDGYCESIGNVINQLRELQARNTVYRIGVAGQVGVGKSTFLNELLGFDLLPVSRGSTTTTPTYISQHDAPIFRAEFHFVSHETVERELRLCYDLQAARSTNDNELRALLERLKRLFEKIKVGNEYTDMIPKDFSYPKIEEDVRGSCGATNIDSVLKATRVVDLVGAKPLIVECESAEALGRVYSAIGWSDPLAYMLHRVDLFGPFENLPPNVVLVDTPGLGDSNRFKSEQTINAIHDLDEVWLLTDQNTPLTLAVEADYLQAAHFCKAAISVFISKADDLDESKYYEGVRKDVEMNLQNNLNPEEDDFGDTIVLSEQERLERNDIITQILKGVVLWKRFQDTQHCGRQRLETIVRNHVTSRINGVREDLDEIERSAFLTPEPPILSADIVQELLSATDDAFNSFYQLSRSQQLGANIYAFSSRYWPTDKRMLYAIMQNSRQGVYEGLNLARDIAQMWASTLLSFGNGLLSSVTKELRLACDTLMGDQEAKSRACRKADNIYNEIMKSLTEFGTARVESRVRFIMWQYGMFWSGPWNGRKQWGRCELPTMYEVAGIIGILSNDLNYSLIQVQDSLKRSALTSGRVHDTLSPHLRERLTTILQTQVSNEDNQCAFCEDDMLCPITLEPMADPVRVGRCGHTFSREGIQGWINLGHFTCPVCRGNLILEGQQVPIFVPDLNLLRRHEEFRTHDHNKPTDGWWNILWRGLFPAVHHHDENNAENGDHVGGTGETKEN